MSPSETLEHEAQRRPRAALAAFAAPLLVIGGSILLAMVLADAPRATVLAALDRALAPGEVGSTPSGKVAVFEYYRDNSAALIGAGAVGGAGYLLIGLALRFLALSTRARSDGFSNLALYAPIVGGALTALASLLFTLAPALSVNTVLDGAGTVDAVADSTSVVAALSPILGLLGTAALAAGFLLVSLSAMRVGLLTRFMGILGMLCGVLTLIPLERVLPGALPFPLVQVFWLFGLGFLFLRRWPGGAPPAWRTGQAEPWPTQQELAEARQARAHQRGGQRSEPAAVAAAGPERSTGTPHPSSRKKKRKRRT